MTNSVNATLAGSRPLAGVSALGKGGMGGGFGVNLFASVFSPLDLFAASEVGAWYDPSDLTTMFQDRAGTTPVTADGQPVGLILDKSKGLVLGPELVTNGDFSNGTTGWSAFNGNTSISVVSGALRVTSNSGTATACTTDAITTVVGKMYEFSINMLGTTGTGYKFYIGNSFGGGGPYTQIPLTGTGSFKVLFVATSTTTYVNLQVTGVAGNYGDFDNISIRELPGNHASQATTANKPLYKTDGTYHWLQFDGVDDSLSTASIDFTGTDEMSVFGGVKKNVSTAAIIAELSSGYSNSGMFYLVSGVDPTDGYTSLGKGTAQISLSLVSTAIVPAPDTSVVTATHDISGDLSRIRRNGTYYTDGTGDKEAGNFGNYPLYIGSRAGTSLPLNGNIYSLIVRGALSTADEITATETWVNQRTGAY